MLKSKTIFTVRIVYKGGYVHDFEVLDFSVKGGSYSWNALSETNKPLQLGADEIAAVWVISKRTKYYLF